MASTIYTPKEIAEKLKITSATVINWIKRGDLEALRVGNQWRITQEQLNEFILQKTMNKGENNHEK
ncbi:helix-turn-helix domain-containing protein [Geobacillus sp. FSL W8-0032]|jgi:putative molybdopterin biosynthesis protein|uniref:helix-turn-helix domain-containing protein n=1 Tax=unclassified Geobacillus TaxID=2642459 RepID=UPI0030DDB5AC